MDRQAIIEELKRRGALAPDILGDLFDKQLAFVKDPAKFKAALCSKRAGKSTACAYYLIHTCLTKPKALCLYITLTHHSAKRILWAAIKEILRKHKIRHKPLKSERLLEFENGSQIYLAGADKEEGNDKFMGNSYDLVVLDECAAFGPHIKELVLSVLGAAVDERQGTICMIGTPGEVCDGWFHEVTGSPPDSGYPYVAEGWSVHHWVQLDNPHFEAWRGKANWRELAKVHIEKVKTTKGFNEARFNRDYCGRWVQASEKLVYRFDSTKNTYAALPAGLTHIIGIDPGFNDEFAVVVLGFSEDLPDVYVVETKHQARLSSQDWIKFVEPMLQQYRPILVVADVAAGGKSFIEELSRRHKMPILPAEKAEKNAAIQLINDDLEIGRVKVHADMTALINQLSTVAWKDAVRKVYPGAGVKDDLCDALLYAYRASTHWAYEAQNEDKEKDPYLQAAIERQERMQGENAEYALLDEVFG